MGGLGAKRRLMTNHWSRASAAVPPASDLKIIFVSLMSAVAVASMVLLSQLLIYKDWLHRTGPLRVIGSVVSGIITFLFVLWRQFERRERQRENIRRFEVIAGMNDRIRNCLQAIAYATYLERPEAIQPVWEAVDRIDEVLREALVQMDPQTAAVAAPRREATSVGRAGN